MGITPFADLTEEEFASFKRIRTTGPFSTGCDKFTSSTKNAL